MGLQTAQGYNLTPDTVGDVSRGLNVGLGYQQAQQKMRQNEQSMRLGNQKSDILAEQQLQDKRNQAMTGAANAVIKSLNLPDDESRTVFWENRVAEIDAGGGNSSDSRQILDLYNTGQGEKANALQQGFAKTAVQTGLVKPEMTKYQQGSLDAGKDRLAFDREKFKSQQYLEQQKINKGRPVSFAGKGMPAQVSNALVRGSNNPEYRNTAEYARAWDIANKPQIIDTEEGRIPLYPEINPIFKPPGPVKSEKEQVANIEKAVEKDVEIIKGTEKKKTTADEKLSAGFLNRMKLAEENIKGLGQFDSADWWEKLKGVTNVTASPELQQYRQAADDWIRSKLRRESGAVIAPEEMAKEYEIYFPQLGDNQPVIDQKKLARTEAVNSMKIASGRASTEKTKSVNWSDLP